VMMEKKEGRDQEVRERKKLRVCGKKGLVM
jgi:hypothetical protein